MLKRKLLEPKLKMASDIFRVQGRYGAIRIEQNLFYVEKSLILENETATRCLHLAPDPRSIIFPIPCMRRDHAFSGNPTPNLSLERHSVGDLISTGLEIESRLFKSSTVPQR